MSTSEGFTVDLDLLEQTVADLAGVHRELADLDARVDAASAALQTTWHGHAAGSHDAAQQRWRAGLHQMADALDRMRAAAEAARGHYRAGAEANLRLWEPLA